MEPFTIWHVGSTVVKLELDHIYKFNHQITHSLSVQDTTSGCVVLMIGEKYI